MPHTHAIIIGAGIAGLASALTLKKHNNLHISIYEIKPQPSSIGGAINLTPNALRYLDHLGVLERVKPKGCEVKRIDVIAQRTGKLLGIVDFDNVERFRERALRVMRNELLEGMLEVLGECGVSVKYGMKIESVVEHQDEESIEARYEDGTIVKGDFLLGCDGIHSAVRSKFVQPERRPEYTGIANVYGFLDAQDLGGELPFDSTALFSGCLGSMLMSFADKGRKRMYTAAVMSTKDVGSRDGWAIKGQDQVALKQDLLRRFSNPQLPFLATAIERVDSVVLYPVYKLPEHGKWTSGRILLLGDAAHAMPPQGESVGLALEDVVLLSRILTHTDKPVQELFEHYTRIRKPRIDAAVSSANWGFDTIKDRGWLSMIVMEWFTWAYLNFRAGSKEEEYAYDVRNIDLDI